MGNRVLIQAYDSSSDGGFGPVLYSHWHGGMTPQVLARFKERMRSRPNDAAYASARLLQEMMNGDAGNTGFGAMNADRLLTAEDSHGDAGVVLVDVATNDFKCTCLGGYLEDDGDGGIWIREG